MKRTMIPALIVLLLGALFTIGTIAGEVTTGSDEGQSLFNKKCALCHGKTGKAKKSAKGSGDFNDPEWQAANSLEQVVADITEGKGKMKAYAGKFTPEQIGMLADYVKSLGAEPAGSPATE